MAFWKIDEEQIVDDRGKRAKIKDNRFQISLPAIDVMGNYYS
jgi:hypothetical protein